MDNIFSHNSYKTFLQNRLLQMPKRGRGELQKIAKALRMHPTRISHVMKGDLHFTAEQACELCRYLGLGELESEYFVMLLQRDRAGTQELRALFDKQIKKIQAQSKELVNRLPRDKVLSEEEKAIFYSSWHYSGIRLATSIPGQDNIDAIASLLKLPRDKVRLMLDFLLTTGLCVEKEGKVGMGPKTTHLEHSSPLILRHHANWRIKALQRQESLGPGELAYTCPVSVREEDLNDIREMLTQCIDRVIKKVVASDPPEKLACLAIDWFKIT